MKYHIFNILVLFFFSTEIIGQIDLNANIPFENEQNMADAFPMFNYESNAIYFIRQSEDFKNSLYKAKLSENRFLVPQKIELEGIDDLVGFWISNDEQLIFISTIEGDFFQLRKQSDTKFGNVEEIKILSNDNSYLVNPSLTQDFSQLYAFSHKRGGIVLKFDRMPDGSYLETSFINLSKKYVQGSGRIAPNDLSFYLSLKDENELMSIYRLNRESVKDDFNFPELILSSNTNLIQPFVSSDESMIAFVKNDSQRWQVNDITVRKLNEHNSEFVENANFVSAIFTSIKTTPNPSNEWNQLTLEIATPQQLSIQLMHQNGQLLKTVFAGRILEGTHTFQSDISDLKAGWYTYRIVTNEGTTSKTFVKQ